jgi:hypothetical protein
MLCINVTFKFLGIFLPNQPKYVLCGQTCICSSRNHKYLGLHKMYFVNTVQSLTNTAKTNHQIWWQTKCTIITGLIMLRISINIADSLCMLTKCITINLWYCCKKYLCPNEDDSLKVYLVYFRY